MGIYIEDIGLPRRNENIVIEIRDNKPVVVGIQNSDGYEDLEEEGLQCNITEVKKPHGRLIDADKLSIQRERYDTYNDYSETFDMIDNAPIVIESEK